MHVSCGGREACGSMWSRHHKSVLIHTEVEVNMQLSLLPFQPMRLRCVRVPLVYDASQQIAYALIQELRPETVLTSHVSDLA